MATVPDDMLPLQRIYHWESARAQEIYLTQPMGAGMTRDFTWGQAVDEARRMAGYLRALNFPQGSRIAILSKNCAWWILSDFAIWMAGHVSVPLYPTLTADSVRQVLEHSEARALFVGKLDQWDSMRAGVPAGMHCISYPLSPKNNFPSWDDIVACTAAIADSPTRAGDELATIIYTSGTTGMPKGVMHPFTSFAAGSDTLGPGFGLCASDRVLSYLPLSHVAERAFVEANSLYCGLHVFFAESLETFGRDLKTARPTVFFSVPRLWVKFQQGVLAKLPQRRLDVLFKLPLAGRWMKKKILAVLGLGQVRIALGGAAPLPASLLSWYRALGLELLEVYGMTENFGLSHGSFAGQGRPGYVGSAWPGTQCKLSEASEVLTRGPTTMTGYYQEPALTRDAFTDDGWFKTGDLGEFDQAGRLKITGRAKELFKTSKGKYVAPAPIENKLTAHARIEAVCVTGVNHAQPFAIVMLAQGVVGDELKSSLAAHLHSVNQTLDAHEQLDFIAVVPEQWTVENGFITPTMKIKRSVVEKFYAPQFDGWARQQQSVVWM